MPTSASPAPTLTTLTLNIGAAAPARATQIERWLRRRSPDVIVLTETSSGKGTTILADGLKARGYTTHAVINQRDRGVMVASRRPVRDVLDAQLDVTLPWRVAGIALDTEPSVTVVGVYVPSRDRSELKVARKRDFIASLLAGVRRLPDAVRRQLLLIGDYNAVARDHQPRLPGFFPYEYEMHDALEGFGLAPAHALRPAASQPHSWIGRTGIGYLYDYVHVGEGLHDRVERCTYMHAPREQRLSDHAAVVARLRLG